MPDIYETSQSYRARLLKREKRAAKRIIAAYAVAARRLVDDLRDLTDQIEAARLRGDLVNEAWLLRQERYQVLLFQIQREISRVAAYAGILITNAQKDAVNLAIKDSANLAAVVAAQAEVTATFNRIAPSAVETLTGTLSDGSPLKSLLDELPRHARTAITETLVQGVTLGWNPRKTAREMKTALNGNMARALRISRTETIRAYREATRASYQANSDIISGWQWVAAKSRRTCLACLSKDGTIYPLEKPMPQHVNCIPAGAMIHSPNIEAVMSRFYEGELLELETVAGHHLAVTPNHPILTTRGWVAAGLLNESDCVISTAFPERVIATVNPNKQHGPSRIEEVVRTLTEDGGMVSVGMPTASEDFHGDGEGSQVHVVSMHGLLRDDFNASTLQPFRHDHFIARDAKQSALSSVGAADFFFNGMSAASQRRMEGANVGSMFFGGSPRHHQSIGLSLPANFHTCGKQSRSYSAAGDMKLPGQFVFRDALIVQGNDFILRQSMPIARFDRNSRTRQQSMNRIMGDPEALSESAARMAGLIQVDKIRKLSKRVFSGHVYNLQTSEQWYIANNIITHNCRCTMISVLIDAPPPEIETGAQWFAAQPDEVKQEMMPGVAWEDFQSGRITLKDFEGRKFHPRWGESVYQRSYREIERGMVRTRAVGI